MYLKVFIIFFLYRFKGKFSIGLGICLDMRYPEISQIYTQRGKYSVNKRQKNMHISQIYRTEREITLHNTKSS